MLEETLILIQIIFIDIILAADNAIIIGLIAANFAPKNRKQIILWGVAGALIFKIIFAVFATYLFEFYFIKICKKMRKNYVKNQFYAECTSLIFNKYLNSNMRIVQYLDKLKVLSYYIYFN